MSEPDKYVEIMVNGKKWKLKPLSNEDKLKIIEGMFGKHPNCRCELDMTPPAMREAGRKFAARVAMIDNRITTATVDEFIGINLLERDDQLERKPK